MPEFTLGQYYKNIRLTGGIQIRFGWFLLSIESIVRRVLHHVIKSPMESVYRHQTIGVDRG